MPHPAQHRHTNHWAPRTRKRHQQEHRRQQPTERSNLTQHAKGRTGGCPGPHKETTTRRNVTQGGGGAKDCRGLVIEQKPAENISLCIEPNGMVSAKPPTTARVSACTMCMCSCLRLYFSTEWSDGLFVSGEGCKSLIPFPTTSTLDPLNNPPNLRQWLAEQEAPPLDVVNEDR